MPIDQASPINTSLWHMISGSSPVVQGVLLILVGLSFMSWAITISKLLQLSRAQKDSSEFQQIFWDSKNLTRVQEVCRSLAASPLVAVFGSGYRELSRILGSRMTSGANKVTLDELDFDVVSQALRRAELEESVRLERGITFLATTASAAPFIGLFGTVWGIMNAFRGLGLAQVSTLQAVAPGISEALVATAIGLAAAIPAAIGYNYFAVVIKRFRESMHKFSNEFITVAKKGN